MTLPVGGSSVVKTSNRSGGTSVFTTEGECAVFEDIEVEADTPLTFRLDQQSTQFGYMNVLKIEKTA